MIWITFVCRLFVHCCLLFVVCCLLFVVLIIFLTDLCCPIIGKEEISNQEIENSSTPNDNSSGDRINEEKGVGKQDDESKEGSQVH